MIVVVMGAAGAGKTTVGRALASAAGWPFYDADDLHPPGNVEKLRRGDPLTDDDREPWLRDIRALTATLSSHRQDAVLACSALRERYRQTIAAGVDARWVYLAAPLELLRERLLQRQGHFAGPAILPAQLDALEEPANALRLDAALPVDQLVRQACAALRLPCGPGA